MLLLFGCMPKFINISHSMSGFISSKAFLKSKNISKSLYFIPTDWCFDLVKAKLLPWFSDLECAPIFLLYYLMVYCPSRYQHFWCSFMWAVLDYFPIILAYIPGCHIVSIKSSNNFIIFPKSIFHSSAGILSLLGAFAFLKCVTVYSIYFLSSMFRRLFRFSSSPTCILLLLLQLYAQLL